MDDGFVSQDKEGVFFVTPYEEICDAAYFRYNDKVNKWIKQGQDNGYWQVAQERMIEDFYGYGDKWPTVACSQESVALT